MSNPPFLEAGGYSWSAQVTAVPALGQQFHLCVRTRYADSRNPQASRVAFNLTLGRPELEQLVRDLQRGLSASCGQETE